MRGPSTLVAALLLLSSVVLRFFILVFLSRKGLLQLHWEACETATGTLGSPLDGYTHGHQSTPFFLCLSDPVAVVQQYHRWGGSGWRKTQVKDGLLGDQNTVGVTQ